MSDRASFESAFKVPLYMRRARAGSITFSFFNEDDTDYNSLDDGRELHFYIRQNPSSTPLVDLTEASGLTVSGNDITAAVTEAQSTRALGMYWWELYDNTNKKTIGLDKLQIGSREPIAADTSVEVTISTTTVRVTVTSGGLAGTQNKGGWDASNDTFPTGAAVGDRYYLTVVGTLASYGQSAVEWPIGSMIEYLGSDNWRIW